MNEPVGAQLDKPIGLLSFMGMLGDSGISDKITERRITKVGMSDKNEKTEYGGLKIRPVFPQDKIDWHKAQTLGPTEEQLLAALYYDLSKWLDDVKTVSKRDGIPLKQHLKKALGLAVEAGRVRDCNYDTGLKLQGPEHTGQDIFLFFVKKCPHAREDLLRGELPPYPWRIPQASGKAWETSGGKTGSRGIDSQDKHEDIVELKPNFCGIGLNINALIRKRKWGIKIKNLLKAFIYRKLWPK